MSHPTAKILYCARDGGENISGGRFGGDATVLGAESTVKATFDFLLTLTEAVRRGDAPDVSSDGGHAVREDYPGCADGGGDAARF